MGLTAAGAWPPARLRPRLPPARVVPAVLALPAAAALGGLASRVPLLAVAGMLVLAAATAIFLRPAVAGYLLVGLTPLIVGIDRGRLIPVLRPNEAVLVLSGGALLARAVWDLRTGTRLRPKLGPVAALLVLMAVFNSVVPVLWMSVRGVAVSGDDIMHAVVLWKYLALYAIVRASIRTAAEARRCLWLAVLAGSVVAVVAVLQSLELFGVPRLLATFYAPYGQETRLSNNRGSSTLALPAATADLLIMSLAVVAGFWRREGFRSPATAPAAGLLVVGVLASGQFSAAIGLVVAIVAIGLVSRRADLPLVFGLVGTAAGIWVLRPVIAQRLSGFDRVSGLPESWVGRLHNLRSYFWPTLFSDQNFLLGVRPSARVPGPQTLAVPWIWIESGYTWLLWGGGIPLFATFVLFVVVSVRQSWRVAQRPDAFGTAATGALIGVVVVAVLMLFDPHITYRGSADLLFSLLAVTAAGAVGTGPAGRADAEPRGTPLPAAARSLGWSRSRLIRGARGGGAMDRGAGRAGDRR